jgi:nicotinamidase-related amidase
MSQSAAVLVIDMANDFVYPGGTIADAGGPEYQQRAQAIIPRLAKLLAAARSAGIPVIYATDAHSAGQGAAQVAAALDERHSTSADRG